MQVRACVLIAEEEGAHLLQVTLSVKTPVTPLVSLPDSPLQDIGTHTSEGRRDDLGNSHGTSKGTGISRPGMQRNSARDDLAATTTWSASTHTHHAVGEASTNKQQQQLTIRAPDIRPAPPTPATALPRIRATELGAAAQTMDPTSKMSSADRNTHLVENSAYSLPKNSCRHAMVTRYAEPYQPTSSIEWNSSVILGMAMPTMERSCCEGTFC